ncbi:hypothetical protein OWV82_003720 [Melia azedarach]|uniref:Uncharacterized protein n=1 Tax=Melia azedarach TaxID=155640 RepID=A0ACC1YNQ1_MELAZ|nr:hypothetical protein OWV82_003720 [Melia azedarach]
MKKAVTSRGHSKEKAKAPRSTAAKPTCTDQVPEQHNHEQNMGYHADTTSTTSPQISAQDVDGNESL